MKLHLVWFKRDLRVRDHQPLCQAARAARRDDGLVLPLYVIEPEYWQQPDTSLRQWQFTLECLQDLGPALASLGEFSTSNTTTDCIGPQPFAQRLAPLQLFEGDVVECLEQLAQHHSLTLYSHEETGNYWTFERDKQVKKWCRQHDVFWHEFRQFGVLRPNKDRDQWADWREQWLTDAVAPTPHAVKFAPIFSENGLKSIAPLSKNSVSGFGFDQTPCPGRQIGGINIAHKTIFSFYHSRSEYYRGSISSPLSAERHCSRLSPYLAMGCISLKELQLHNRKHIEKLQQQPQPNRQWLGSLRNFESRLWWHCHFIQKLEDEPESQWQSLHPAYRSLRSDCKPQYWQAWRNGQTGWPLVDAAMRYLEHHGWINFRLRAMLMSIACYPLWLDWQQPAQRLAQLFVDYEPGIHYPQAQMQAGATGINVLRMYNPTQQAIKLDPNGVFIRRWLPELKNVPDTFIHQPWLMNQRQQQACGVFMERDYPAPVVNFEQAIRYARSQLKGITKAPEFRQHASRIGHKHGSRQRSNITTRPAAKTASSQLSLF